MKGRERERERHVRERWWVLSLVSPLDVRYEVNSQAIGLEHCQKSG